MGNLNTKQTANDLLGRSKLVYRINCDIPQPLRSQKDLVGFGEPFFKHEGNADTNPQNIPSASGLKISLERSATTPAAGVISYSITVNVQNLATPLPEKLVLIGCFSDMSVNLLSAQGQSGTIAATVVITYGNGVSGTTVQVRDNTARHNFPGTSSGNSFQFSQAFYTQVVNPGDPHHFNIVLYLERTAQAITGEGFVYAGDQKVSSKTFTVNNNVNKNTVIDQFNIGLASANGALYQASLLLHEAEIWFPD
ncbi:MAG TPA: hypothetical protein VK166_06250 [Chitinophagaceae bacterium]|nr:hypothetical protein [Chitinophagaceae bacterium]